jgi:hypothetical protein
MGNMKDKKEWVCCLHISDQRYSRIRCFWARWDIRVPRVTLQLGKETEIIVRVSQIMAFTL